MSENQQTVSAKLGPDLSAEFSSVQDALIFIARTTTNMEDFARYARELDPALKRPRSTWLDYRQSKYGLHFKRILRETPLSDGRKLYEAIGGKKS